MLKATCLIILQNLAMSIGSLARTCVLYFRSDLRAVVEIVLLEAFAGLISFYLGDNDKSMTAKIDPTAK